MKKHVFKFLLAIMLMASNTQGQFVSFPAGLSGNTYIQPQLPTWNHESLGMGDFNTMSTLPPASTIHVNTNLFAFGLSYAPGEVFRTDVPLSANSFWRMLRDGTIYGNIYNRADLNFYFEAPEGDAVIRAKGTPTGFVNERVRATSGLGGDGNGLYTIPDGTEVIIQRGATASQMLFPQANLNVGSDVGPTPSGGRRPWMEVGTYYAYDKDHMYTGILDAGSDLKDGVINWGNDPAGNIRPAEESLRFLFTDIYSVGNNDPYDPKSLLGLEVGRMSANGNMGIGPLFSSSAQPVRRLEIVDDGVNHINHNGGPQLRLSNVQSTGTNTTTTGTWTDFQTTSLGHLVINPSNTGVNQNVGINTGIIPPAATLEINSNVTSTTGTPGPGGTGNSGLMFQDLNTLSTPLTTHPWATSPNGLAVLSVDAQGDVVLVRDGGGTVTSTCVNPNFVPLMTSPTNIGCSQIFDNLTTVGIGMGTGVTAVPNIRLHIRNDMLIQAGGISMLNGGAVERMLYQFGNVGTGALAIGPNAGPTNLALAPTANTSIYIGRNAGAATTNNFGNTFVGVESGDNLTFAPNIGNANSFFGFQAGNVITTGNNNLMLGNQAGPALNSGNNNILIGTLAGDLAATPMNTGDGNILIGNRTVVNEPTANNIVLLGAQAIAQTTTGTINNAGTIGFLGRVLCDNCFTIGSQSPFIAQQQIGIGVSTPTATIPLTGTGVGGLAKLYVSGYPNPGALPIAAHFNGDIYTPTVYYPSDSSLKENIQSFTDATSIINSLEAKSYNFNHNDFPGMNLPQGNQIGFMASDISAVAPQLVRGFTTPAEKDSLGNIITAEVPFAGVNYTGLIPILFTAIKQQQERLDSLELVMSLCCALPIPTPNPTPNTENRASIQLTNKSTIILNQNSPNPFREKTDISYSIPESVKTALILFYDQSGRVINTHEINHKGDGTLTVYGENLEAGIYSYTLIIDGEAFKTKKMVKE